MTYGGFLHPLHIADVVDVTVLIQGIGGNSELVRKDRIGGGIVHGVIYWKFRS
jgi:hypothetical protein